MRDGGPEEADAGGTGAEGAGHRDDPGLFATGAGRSEQRFGTWQGRLLQELRLAGNTNVEEANRFLLRRYIPEMDRNLGVPAE